MVLDDGDVAVGLLEDFNGVARDGTPLPVVRSCVVVNSMAPTSTPILTAESVMSYVEAVKLQTELVPMETSFAATIATPLPMVSVLVSFCWKSGKSRATLPRPTLVFTCLNVSEMSECVPTLTEPCVDVRLVFPASSVSVVAVSFHLYTPAVPVTPPTATATLLNVSPCFCSASMVMSPRAIISLS